MNIPTITIEVQTPQASLIRKALEAEMKSLPYKKTSTFLKEERTSLVVTIEGEDLRALRGTFNSYMNWLITILESLSL